MKPLKCLVFDAYGTVFDVHSIVTALDRIFPGQGPEVSKAWRTRQLEYTWLRSLMDRYEDFWKVTESALVATCNAMKLHLEAKTRDELMKAYLSLKPFPEVKETLSALSEIPKAILSNGNPKMLEDVVKNAGLEGAFSQLLSVEEAKIYKPSPAAYKLAVKKMGANAESIGFVSSNFFDVAGAKVFGFRTYWVNRSNIPGEDLGVTPDAIFKSFSDLIGLVKV